MPRIEGSFDVEMTTDTFHCSFNYFVLKGVTFSATDSNPNPKLRLKFSENVPIETGPTASIKAIIEKI